MLSGNQALAEQVVAELATNPLRTFVTLLANEQEQQQEQKQGEDRRDRKEKDAREAKDATPDGRAEELQCRP